MIAVITTLRDSRSAVLADVSSTGARLRGRNLPAEHEDLFIAVDGLSVFGTVAWADGDERGVSFDVPLQPGDEAILRERMVQGQGLPLELKAALDDWAQGFAR
ncbi:PilZ domain-containing protein [Sphingomonas sp. SM33]|uniref:PilZ domain-containing protein n=1 Tax=Sphingomonas telluris TaxID=2907998 RepID=A0ABS9VJC6_9SPHN|nr:PilZ domain-containing protein [Sphingomonas telluris]